MCRFGSCKTRFEFLSQFRKVRNAFECFVTQVQTHLPKTKRVWPMKICSVGNDTCIYYCPPWECSASSHCCKVASWPTRPVRTRRMVDKTLRRVSRTAREAGSSWSCVASNGSTEWILHNAHASPPEVPCSLGSMPPRRHHRRAGAG